MSATIQEMAPPLAPTELESLARIHQASFGEEGWSAGSLEGSLALPTTRGWTARAGTAEDPCGFLLLQATGPENELLTLAVLPSLRRQGIGRALLEEALRSLPPGAFVHLEVAADNAAARQLYARCGFTETGRRLAYYRRAHGPAVDALTLRHHTTRTRT